MQAERRVEMQVEMQAERRWRCHLLPPLHGLLGFRSKACLCHLRGARYTIVNLSGHKSGCVIMCRLLDFLSCRYTHSSREAWSAHGKAGRICLDAIPVSPDTVLRAGQLLEYHRPPWREPPAPRWLWPLLDDEHVLVLLKPSGLPVLP